MSKYRQEFSILAGFIRRELGYFKYNNGTRRNKKINREENMQSITKEERFKLYCVTENIIKDTSE